MPNNWGDFQHYKDRNPPWIKLQKTLLDNFDFHRLPVASRALAPMLWLLASESKDPKTGEFDGSVEKLAFRLRQTEKEISTALNPLIESGFFIVVQDASDTLAGCLQDAVPETETETETETEADGGAPEGLDASAWTRWIEYRIKIRKPIKPASILAAQRKLAGFGCDQAEVVEQSIAEGYQGLFPIKNRQKPKAGGIFDGAI